VGQPAWGGFVGFVPSKKVAAGKPITAILKCQKGFGVGLVALVGFVLESALDVNEQSRDMGVARMARRSWIDRLAREDGAACDDG
jgi:hypothetical protein